MSAPGFKHRETLNLSQELPTLGKMAQIKFAIFSVFLLGFIPKNLCRIRLLMLTNPVQTEAGTLVGLNFSTVLNNVSYSSYRGIPYAEPPLGDLRFEPPRPKESWNGIWCVFNDRDSCIQMENGEVVGSEDCLYLNVYVPNTNFDDVLKPVIVWIHGGDFKTGNGRSSNYGPDFLLEREVVVISIQYRLGPLGFLNVNHPSVSGNNGLKDQVLALKWVQNNIRNFRGDPHRVTVLGHSAGGLSVDLHKLSDMSAGLFQQTISMSASPLCLYCAFQSSVEAQTQAFLLGTKFGVENGDTEGLINKLRGVTAKKIIEKANELPMILFRPTLEISDAAPRFLTECPLNRYSEGNYHKGPHMMGFTSAGILSMANTLDSLVKWHDNAAETVKKFTFVKNLPVLPNFLAVKSNLNTNLTKIAFKNLIEELLDTYFLTGIDMKQRLLAETNEAPVYYYKYDFHDSHDSAHESNGTSVLNGIAHEDELSHLFYRPHLNISLKESRNAIIRTTLVKLWTNFARHGNPTPPHTNSNLTNITWPDSGRGGRYVRISDDGLTVYPRSTNALIKLYQKFCFGSSIYNKCSENLLNNIVNSLTIIFNSTTKVIRKAVDNLNKFESPLMNSSVDSRSPLKKSTLKPIRFPRTFMRFG